MVTTLTPGVIDQFQRSLSEKGLSQNTLKAYLTDVRMFFKELDLESCRAADLPTLAADWMNKSKAARVAPKTIRRRATSIRSFGSHFGVTGILLDHKMPALGQHVPHPLPGLDADLENMLDLCKTEEQSALIGLLGLMGLRLFEALTLEPSDFNINKMSLVVHGKGGKVRELPFTKRAWSHIGPRYLTAVVMGFPSIIDYSDRGARNFITELGARAKVSRSVSSHDLRATFATLVYGKSKDIAALRIWLGHESIETTRMYVQIAQEALRAAGDI